MVVGDQSVNVYEFGSASDATRFMQASKAAAVKTSEAPVPGVPNSEMSGSTAGPPSVAGFGFVFNNLLIWGLANCSYSDTCNDLQTTIAKSIYGALTHPS